MRNTYLHLPSHSTGFFTLLFQLDSFTWHLSKHLKKHFCCVFTQSHIPLLGRFIAPSPPPPLGPSILVSELSLCLDLFQGSSLPEGFHFLIFLDFQQVGVASIHVNKLSLARFYWWWGWWWTGKPGMLQSMGSQRVGHDWVTELKTLLVPLVYSETH